MRRGSHAAKRLHCCRHLHHPGGLRDDFNADGGATLPRVAAQRTGLVLILDQVDRRLIKGETTPHGREDISSHPWNPSTLWINKYNME